MDTVKLLAALGQLDVKNDNHWTEEGLPRLETVKMLAGDQSLTRAAVTSAKPSFSRTNPLLTEEHDPKPPEANDASQGNAGDVLGQLAQAEQATQEASDAQDARVGLAEQLEHAQERQKLWAGRKVEAHREHAEASEEVDRLTLALEKIVPPENLQSHLQGYFARQQAERDNRAEHIAAFKASGFKVKDLLPKVAPIDTAMARKTARGAGRPSVPLK